MRLLEQLQVPPSWAHDDGERNWAVRLLAPARDTSLWQALVLLSLGTLGCVQAALLDVHDKAYGKLVVIGVLGVLGLGRIGRRLVQAKRLSPDRTGGLR